MKKRKNDFKKNMAKFKKEIECMHISELLALKDLALKRGGYRWSMVCELIKLRGGQIW